MLSRRLLRVKVMQMVYAFNKRGDVSIQEMEKELFYSISKSYELYHFLLLLITELHGYALKKIEKGKSKKVPSPSDLNPNTRFIDNRVLLQLVSSTHLNKYQDASGISWGNNEDVVRSLFNEVLASDLYQNYMDSEFVDYEDDKKFVVKLVEKVIAQYEPLYSQIEEQSIFWNDEAEFIVSMVIKTLKEFKEDRGDDQVFQKEFKDADDKKFVSTLFRKSLLNQKEFIELVKKYAQNWDLDRVAYMDIVLMQIAITDILN